MIFNINIIYIIKMATADWKNINLILKKDTPISIKLNDGIIKVIFGDYEADLILNHFVMKVLD